VLKKLFELRHFNINPAADVAGTSRVDLLQSDAHNQTLSNPQL
jgi:hypothetical protein